MKTRSWLWMVLMAVGVGARAATVSVTWDAVTTNADGSPIADLSGYRLFYANHSLLGLTTGQATTDGTVTKKTIPSSTVGDTLTLLDGASYYFRVTAFDQSGNQSDFNVDNANLDVEISTYIPRPPAPAGPASLTATPVSSTQINLAWSNVSGETGYRIEGSLDNITYSTITTVGANVTTYSSGIPTPLTPSTLYYYRVFAINGSGEGMSPVASATTQAPPTSQPTQPSNLHATAVSSTSISLSWNDNSTDETGFELQWSLTGTGGWNTIGVGAGVGMGVIPYTHPSLPAGTSYYYKVRAVNTVKPDLAFGSTILSRTLTAPGSVGGTGFGGAPAGLKQAYVFPNPAVGVDPIIRAIMGDVESMEVTIFDASGHAVKSDRVTGLTMVNGQAASDYKWVGAPGGMYFAVMHGRKGEQVYRARTKFAVVK